MQPKVSMVMPCYNKVKYIGEMFDSIIAQRWDNIELILVNDGSTDGTREVIAAYEPRFRERGFEVVIVDQQNAGVCAAAKAGLLRVTGEFVCMVDSDDELDPGYVSTMAGWLEGHREYDVVACEGADYTGTGTQKVFRYPSYMPVFDISPCLAERYLLTTMRSTVWIYMVRATYLERCRIVQTYHTNTKGSHEPGYIIPLLLYEGRIKHIQQPLYRFNQTDDGHSRFTRYEQALAFYDEYEKLCEISIEALPEHVANAARKARLRAVSRFSKELHLYSLAKTLSYDPMHSERALTRALECSNASFAKGKPLCREDIRGYEAHFLNTVSLFLSGQPLKHIDRTRGRVIGYGVLGKAAGKLLPMLRATPLEPTEQWDVAGDGITVKKPDMDSLSEDDTVLIFPIGGAGKALRETFKPLPCRVLLNADIHYMLGMQRFGTYLVGEGVKEPVVSVVIPVYQVEKYLSQCVDSVISQTFSYLEIILVDDGSTDTSPAICDAYACADSRVRVIHQRNKGLSEARNAGLSIALGEYVYFLDSDDFIREDAIERLLTVAKEKDTDIVLFDAVVVGEEGQPLTDERSLRMFKRKSAYLDVMPGQEMMREMMLNRDYTMIAQLMFLKRSFLMEHALTFYPGILHEDNLFSFTAHMQAKRVAHMPDRLFYRRIRENSIMTSKFTHKNVYGMCITIQEMLEEYDAHPMWARCEEFATSIVNLLINAICRYIDIDAVEKVEIGELLDEVRDRVKRCAWITRLYPLKTGFLKEYTNADKVIFYGAGEYGRRTLRYCGLTNMRMPDVIWDREPTNTSSVCGVRITHPDFATLHGQSNWVIIICVSSISIVDEITERCATEGFFGVHTYRDLYDAMFYALRLAE